MEGGAERRTRVQIGLVHVVEREDIVLTRREQVKQRKGQRNALNLRLGTLWQVAVGVLRVESEAPTVGLWNEGRSAERG